MVTNFATLDKALTATKNIDTIIYAGHAGVPKTFRDSSGKLVHPKRAVLFLEGAVTGSANISNAEIARLNTKNVKKKAFIFLVGCGTTATRNQPRVGQFEGIGLPAGEVSLATAFARRFDTTVYGFDEHVSPGPARSLTLLGGHFTFERWYDTRRSVFFPCLGELYFHNGTQGIFPVAKRPNSKN